VMGDDVVDALGSDELGAAVGRAGSDWSRPAAKPPPANIRPPAPVRNERREIAMVILLRR
jgi:hypothetical protein